MTPDLLRLESRPLAADDAMTPGTARDADDYYNTSSTLAAEQQQQQHPLSEVVRARYADKNARHAVVSVERYSTINAP